MSNRRALWAISAVLLCGGLAAGGLIEPAHAQAAKPKPKPKPKQLFPYWENYLRIPAAERTRFQLAYFLQSGGKPLTDLELFVVDGARRAPIAVGPDGRLTPPPLALLQSKTAVVDAPGATGRNFNISLELLATAAPAREMEAATLSAAINEANAGIRKAAGPIGMVAPKMARVSFLGAGSGEAVDAQGRRTPLPVAAGAPYFQPASLPGAQRVILARTPTRLELSPAPKGKG
jgi:hypothetical protein